MKSEVQIRAALTAYTLLVVVDADVCLPVWPWQCVTILLWLPPQQPACCWYLKALSEWLKAHAAAVPVESINVQGWDTLKLPVEQLPKLRALDLGRVSVSWTHAQLDEPVPSEQPPELPAELSACPTHLTLNDCPLELTRLGDFQQLQHLALLEWHRDSHAASSSDCEALAAALPRLQHLTQLVLQHSWAPDAVLSAVHQLPRLLVLDVSNSSCTAARFAALPAMLTKLVIAHCSELVCGPSTTPG